MSAVIDDPLAKLDASELATLRSVADRLIPATSDMPSAADVLTDVRLRFVLDARPDLLEPLRAALGFALPCVVFLTTRGRGADQAENENGETPKQRARAPAIRCGHRCL